MSSFFGAFWRELGRNTGKVVSNGLFGDRWSTPYRFGGRNGGRNGGSNGCVGCFGSVLLFPFKLTWWIIKWTFIIILSPILIVIWLFKLLNE